MDGMQEKAQDLTRLKLHPLKPPLLSATLSNAAIARQDRFAIGPSPSVTAIFVRKGLELSAFGVSAEGTMGWNF
jgi:hypothetical protein